MINTELREKTIIAGLLMVGIIAAIFLVAAVLHGTRGDEMDRTKFYVTATITDETGRVYTKLAYNQAGPFDSKDACEKWAPDDVFKAAVPVLLEKAAAAFGPGTAVHFACEQPPELGDKV